MITPLRASTSSAAPLPPDWTREAACRDRTKLDWIDPTAEQAELCRAVCAGCPVRRECLLTALTEGEPWGIWGGLDIDERADLARRGGFPPPNVLPRHGVHSRYIRHRCRCDACRYAHALYMRQRRRISRASRADGACASGE